MLHKLAKFHYQTVITSQVILWNLFGVSCLGIWWRHNIWISEKLKFDYLINAFDGKWKCFSFFRKCSPLDIKKQTCKNIVVKTFERKLHHNFEMKKGAKEGDFDRLFTFMFLLCNCNGVLNKFNKWYASWIHDVAIKWSLVWTLKGKCSSTFPKFQKKSKNLRSSPWAIAVDSFWSSFRHQEKPKQPSYISGIRSCQS